MTDRRKLSISATRISVLSYTALSGLHWKPDYPVLPEKERFCGILASVRPLLPLSCGHHPAAFLVIPFFRRSYIIPTANTVLLICIPPAQQRIISHTGIPEHSHVCSTGHCHEYPHGFSPMQAFRLLTYRKLSSLRTVDIPLMH